MRYPPGCGGKASYDSPEEAKTNIRWMERNLQTGKHLQPYKCRYCEKWHVGGIPKKR